MKQKITLSGLIIFMMTAVGATETAHAQNSDYFTINVGDKSYALVLDENFSMTWPGGVLTIASKDTTLKIPITDGLVMDVKNLPEGSGTANEKIGAAPFKAYFSGDALIVEASKPVGNVYIYNYFGQLVEKLSLKDVSNVIYPNYLPSGIYIIKTDAGTIKTVKSK